MCAPASWASSRSPIAPSRPSRKYFVASAGENRRPSHRRSIQADSLRWPQGARSAIGQIESTHARLPIQVLEPEMQQHRREEDEVQGQQAQRRENERALLKEDVEESEPLDIIRDDKNEDQRQAPFRARPPDRREAVLLSGRRRTTRPQAASSQRRWPRSSAPVQRASRKAIGRDRQPAAPHTMTTRPRRVTAGQPGYAPKQSDRGRVDRARAGENAQRVQRNEAGLPDPARRQVVLLVSIEQVEHQRRDQVLAGHFRPVDDSQSRRFARPAAK